MNNNEINIFEVASRKKLKFDFRGKQEVDNLWDLPLELLDEIYVGLKSQLKESNQESLLKSKNTIKTKQEEELDLRIKIVKHIFETKAEEEKSRLDASVKKEKKQKLLELYNSKKDEELKNKTPEEILKMIEEIDS